MHQSLLADPFRPYPHDYAHGYFIKSDSDLLPTMDY